jgi:hypothetical protein
MNLTILFSMPTQTLKLLSSRAHYENCRATQDPHNITAVLRSL